MEKSKIKIENDILKFKNKSIVIPAKAGIQSIVTNTDCNTLDPRFRGGDKVNPFCILNCHFNL